MPRKSNSKLETHADENIHLIPKITSVEANQIASRDERKREAKEPIYLSRV